MQVICKNCGIPFVRVQLTNRSGKPRVHCRPKCTEEYRRKRTVQRYRDDPAFRRYVQIDNLNRYYEKKEKRT